MTDPGGYRSYATDDLVTGEGVAVEVPVASVAARMAGGAIDVFLVLVVLVIGVFVFGAVTAAASEAVQGIAGILLTSMVLIGMPATIETLSRGRSVMMGRPCPGGTSRRSRRLRPTRHR